MLIVEQIKPRSDPIPLGYISSAEDIYRLIHEFEKRVNIRIYNGVSLENTLQILVTLDQVSIRFTEVTVIPTAQFIENVGQLIESYQIGRAHV